MFSDIRLYDSVFHGCYLFQRRALKKGPFAFISVLLARTDRDNLVLILHPSMGLALAGASTMVAAFFFYLLYQMRQTYLLAWGLSWLGLALVDFRFSQYISAISPRAIDGMQDWLLFLSALGFLKGTHLYTRSQMRMRWFIAAAAGAGLWVLAQYEGWFSLPIRLAVFFVFLLAGRAMLLESKKQQARVDTILAFSFAVWGLFVFLVPFQPHVLWLASMDMRLPILLPRIATAILMVVVTYEEERRGLEGNILALSNLNLSASSFAGGEIQRMLGYALDRVLTLARLSCGMLCLQYGDAQGPKIFVSSGLQEGFRTAMQTEDLDEYTLRLVARLGGLVVLQDILREASWEALDREPSFHHVRQLLLGQGMQTAVGISLQSKERVFGLMLLGTPHRRRLAPPELRLLLALGQQIGLAVENSYLIQQTARRSEELHTLNEIGRALSATLEAEGIFEKIYEEVQRLFHSGEFYIALLNSARNEISFELEIREGERQPRRSAPVGNHLIEHIIRTQHSVLVREKFEDVMRQLTIIPREDAGSYCGVPLILNERAIGALALFSRDENAFDDGHVEMLRVLSSEASIALENARLFEEEQRKSRQLALLNGISKDAISTLNPEEMLAKITGALEEGLSYDHIGIALLDDDARDLIVRAEGGRRRGAQGRSKALGEGLVGKAALSGEPEVLQPDSSGGIGTILEGSISAAALPVIYAERLQGVLYVESSVALEFSEEDLRLLRTLADLLAMALHNAFTFQKAQEQAITDGLTGLKTHRFLMESLSTEWKRATRAGRTFSIVLLDLDRFKHVNDLHGHLEGDLVLQVVARILEQNCRRSDVVARYGGDEFVILMPETNAEQARQIAGKLREWIAGDRLLREKKVTASFGIAGFPLHGLNPQELIQVADAAMYFSKDSGGNTVSDPGSAPHSDPGRWKAELLEMNLGITPGKDFVTGAELFAEVKKRLHQLALNYPGDGQEMPGWEAPPVLVDTLTSLAVALDARDPLMQGHSQRVAAYAVLAAQAAGCESAEIDKIRLASLLHDIGFLGIDESLWRKQGPLNSAEWEIIKTHPKLGSSLLESVYRLEEVRAMVESHHEFFNGSGYPGGLQGQAIPRGARLIAISEAYDALTTSRPYAKARTAEDGCAVLQCDSGSQFDPALVSVFVATVHRLPRPLLDHGVGVSSPGGSELAAR